MQKHVSYETAVALHKLGYSEYTEDLYLFAKVGIRIERTHTDGNKTERTFLNGTLCQRDVEWGINYPSENWIPAPFVFDVVKWLEESMGIKICPTMCADGWKYNIVFPVSLEWLKPFDKTKNMRPVEIRNEVFQTLELAFEDAVNEIMTSAYISCWSYRIEIKFKDSMNKMIQSQFK